MPPTLTTEEFIARAKAIHQDRYDYSESIYTGSRELLTIKCSKHGLFRQTPEIHLRHKGGCQKCALEYKSKQLCSNLETFVVKARSKYGDKYDYSIARYVHSKKSITIICPDHGWFEQSPVDHLHRTPICCAGKRKKKADEYLCAIKEKYGDKYCYGAFIYISSHVASTVVCWKHGPFEVTPYKHLKLNRGCPMCKPKSK